jgi:serine/threonine protein kinase
MDERSIFMAALERESAPERSAYLDEACAGDTALRQRVEALLASHEQAGSFLRKPVPERLAEKVAAQEQMEETSGETPAGQEGHGPLSEGQGSRIGLYKLLQEIGEGGMGTVFLGEQSEPVRRLVALKIIKPGMDSKQVIARFEAERQALALMEHPNIARVLDGGTTVSGRPFFVMELVKGVPITRFCDERRLTPQQRLELFVPVCQAVQHAHQKGVIHRDLKPSNVMVCLYDGHPVPKVIDFGIAKATGQKLTERTLFTEIGQVVGTLEYMSPEQAELNQLDIDTRSDIYSLGVLLYELLTGTTPLDRKRLKATAMLELLRIIREEEPPKPSTRLSSTEEMPSIAANRGLEPSRLSGLLRGSLARGARLDRDEGAGKGSGPPLRFGQRLGSGHSALPGRRAGAGLSAVGMVSVSEIRATAPGGPVDDRRAIGGADPGQRHGRLGAVGSRGAASDAKCRDRAHRERGPGQGSPVGRASPEVAGCEERGSGGDPGGVATG